MVPGSASIRTLTQHQDPDGEHEIKLSVAQDNMKDDSQNG